MASGWCPECDTLRPITSIGPDGKEHRIKKGFSARWWFMTVHKHPDKPEICEGSGARV